MVKNKLYIRGLKLVQGQRFASVKYANDKSGMNSTYDPIIGKTVGRMSGDSVKWHVLDLTQQHIRYTFYTHCRYINAIVVKEGKTKERLTPDMIMALNNPEFVVALWKGWLYLDPYINKLLSIDAGREKRTGSLEVSDLKPIHGTMASIDRSSTVVNVEKYPGHVETIFYDKLGDNKSPVPVKYEESEELDEIRKKYMARHDVYRKFNGTDFETCSGLYSFDINIDLDRLFTVDRREISDKMWDELIENGWKVIDEENNLVDPAIVRQKANKYVIYRLLMPEERHDPKFLGRSDCYRGLAYGIVMWKYESQNSRNLDMMPTISISVSDNPVEINKVYTAVPVKLKSPKKDEKIDGEKTEPIELAISSWKYKLKIYDESDEVKIFNSQKLQEVAPDYTTSNPNKFSYDALENSVEYIASRIKEFCDKTYPV